MKAAVGRLDFDGVEDFEVPARGLERFADDLAGRQVDQPRVDDQQRPLEAHVFEVHADFARRARARSGGWKWKAERRCRGLSLVRFQRFCDA